MNKQMDRIKSSQQPRGLSSRMRGRYDERLHFVVRYVRHKNNIKCLDALKNATLE